MKFAFFSYGITNAAANKLVSMVGKKSHEIKAVYITTAANTYPPEPGWLIQTQKELKSIFPNLEVFDLEKAYKDKVDLKKHFVDKDLVFFSGGNTFYLLYWIRKTDFDLLLKKMMKRGVVYAGESAGVVCQIEDLTPIAWLDEPKKAPKSMKKGLMFTDLIVIPHWNNPKYQKKLIKTKNYYENRGLSVEIIEDSQAIFVNGKKVEKVSD